MNNHKSELKAVWPFLINNNHKTIQEYIKNIYGEVEVYSINSQQFPVFINNQSESWICSLLTCHVHYLKKILRTEHINKISINLILAVRSLLAKIIDIDAVVFFNHNLTSTNLWPENINNIDEFKKTSSKYLNRPIVFRSLNYIHNKNIINTLLAIGCELIPYREIVCFDPMKILNKKQRRNLKSDLKLLKNNEYKIVTAKDLTDNDFLRIQHLYKMLYIDKFTPLSPQYTVKFFQHILKDKSFGIVCLKKETIDAFAIFEQRNHVIQFPLIGYDTSLPKEVNLYRQLTILAFDFSIKHNLQFNCSSGVLRFKINRGGFQISEYCAVYVDHLSIFKRYAWKFYLFFFKKSWAFVEKNIIKHLRNS